MMLWDPGLLYMHLRGQHLLFMNFKGCRVGICQQLRVQEWASCVGSMCALREAEAKQIRGGHACLKHLEKQIEIEKWGCPVLGFLKIAVQIEVYTELRC